MENQPGARIGPPQWSHYKWGHLQMNLVIPNVKVPVSRFWGHYFVIVPKLVVHIKLVPDLIFVTKTTHQLYKHKVIWVDFMNSLVFIKCLQHTCSWSHRYGTYLVVVVLLLLSILVFSIYKIGLCTSAMSHPSSHVYTDSSCTCNSTVWHQSL